MCQCAISILLTIVLHSHHHTLAELLIVVSIIAVLVEVSIPIFTSQLHKAEVATDWANVRAYYAELQADYLSTVLPGAWPQYLSCTSIL